MLEEFDELKETTLEDCPQLKPDDFIDCTPITEVATEITNHKIRTTIEGFFIKKGGLLGKDVVVWQISSNSPQVRLFSTREDADFYELRKHLLIHYPYMMIPPLPPKKTSTREHAIEKRQRLYQRFLHALQKSEVLKTCQLFVDFLKVETSLEY